MDNEAHGDETLVEMINERAASRMPVEGPAKAMLDQSRLMLFRRHLPQFLKADAEFLWVAIPVQANRAIRIFVRLPRALRRTAYIFRATPCRG